VPHATSSTRAGGAARSRTSTSTIAGSHSVPSKLMNRARFGSARPSGSHGRGGGAFPTRNASTSCGSERPARMRRGAQATPARTVRWFQCVRQAAMTWPHRLLRVPDTARVVHQDKWCRAPTRLQHCRTAASATPPSDQQRAPDPRQHAPVRTAPVRPRTSPAPPVGKDHQASSWNRLSSHGPNRSQVECHRSSVLARHPRPRRQASSLLTLG
jgi:hypothetical protein